MSWVQRTKLFKIHFARACYHNLLEKFTHCSFLVGVYSQAQNVKLREAMGSLTEDVNNLAGAELDMVRAAVFP